MTNVLDTNDDARSAALRPRGSSSNYERALVAFGEYLDERPPRLGWVRNYEQAVETFGRERVDLTVDHIWSWDELATAWLDESRTLPAGAGRTMLDQASTRGIDTVENAPSSLVALFEQLDRVPDWVDYDQLDRGAIAYWRAGWTLTTFAYATGVFVKGYGSWIATRAPFFTGRLEQMSYRRLRETLLWFIRSIRPGGLQRFSPGFALTVRVRLLHTVVSQALARSPKWEWDRMAVPVSLLDRQYTACYAFAVAPPESLIQFGVRLSDRELEDIQAVFRYVAYLMGVPECLLPWSYAEAVEQRRLYGLMDHPLDEGNAQLVGSLMRAAATRGEGYEGVPRWIRMLFSPDRLYDLYTGLTHFCVGDEYANSVAIPDSRWRRVGPPVRQLVGASERLRKLTGRNDEQACWRTLRGFEKSLGEVTDIVEISEAHSH
jgi:ER-bound oxygenase mpaB/B'/Rubber oxygenase, catalytic domain